MAQSRWLFKDPNSLLLVPLPSSRVLVSHWILLGEETAPEDLGKMICGLSPSDRAQLGSNPTEREAGKGKPALCVPKDSEDMGPESMQPFSWAVRWC